MPRAVVVKSFAADATSQLEVVEKPLPQRGSGETLVRVTCRPVNPADVLSLMGYYPGFRPKSFPAVPGLEGCGVVEDAGDDATLKKGQRVIVFFDALNGNGSWQEYVSVPTVNVIPIPDSVSDDAAAQFLVNPVTVLGLLEILAAPKGSYVMQSAAGSTLGRQLIVIAKMKGLKTINIVRREEQAAELTALGADHVICSTTVPSLPDKVREITGGAMAYGAVDAVAGALTAQISNCVRNGGTVLVYGALSGVSFEGSVVDAIFRGVSIRGFWLSSWLQEIGSRKSEVFSEVLSLLSSHALVPHSGEKFPLEQVKEAVAKSTETARGGKVLLVSNL